VWAWAIPDLGLTTTVMSQDGAMPQQQFVMQPGPAQQQQRAQQSVLKAPVEKRGVKRTKVFSFSSAVAGPVMWFFSDGSFSRVNRMGLTRRAKACDT